MLRNLGQYLLPLILTEIVVGSQVGSSGLIRKGPSWNFYLSPQSCRGGFGNFLEIHIFYES